MRIAQLIAWDDVAAVEQHGRVARLQYRSSRRAAEIGPHHAGRVKRCALGAKDRPPAHLPTRGIIASRLQLASPRTEPAVRVRLETWQGTASVVRPDDVLRRRMELPRANCLASVKGSKQRAFETSAWIARFNPDQLVVAVLRRRISLWLISIRRESYNERLIAAGLHSEKGTTEP